MAAEGDVKPADDVSFESNAFETLERDFQEVLTELVGDKSLERFRLEYEKLHRALKKSHESEKRLIKKCRELNAEIVSNAAKVQTALKLSQEDQNTIASLKREIEKAWKMVDASHEKEARAKETIQQLKTEIQNLSRLVEQGAGLSMGQETAVNELLKAKEELTAERDAQTVRIADMRGEIAQILDRMRRMDQDKLAADREMQTLKELVSTKKAEAEREVRRKERLDKEVRDIRHLTETRTQELRAKNDQLTKLAEKLGLLEGQHRAQKTATEQAQKDVEAQRVRHAKVGQEVEEQVVQIAALRAENTKQAEELRRKDVEADQCRQDIQKRLKDRDAALKRNKHLEEGKVELQRQRDALRAACASLEREIASEDADREADRKAIADFDRERAQLNTALKKADGATSKQLDLVKLNEHMIAELEAEIGAYKAEALRQKKAAYSLEQEREKYADEASEVSGKYNHIVEDVKLREMAILDLHKKIGEAESKLKQQQKLYEAVRSDRNLYSKNLIEAQDEMAEMKRKFKIMNHQIEQLKEEIQAKEAAFVKEHFEHAKVEKEREAYKADLDRVKRAVAASDLAISNYEKDTDKLNHIINDTDQARLRQKREYDQVITERDILGSQLIRRNDELALLYEKLRVQQQTLSDGERTYAQRVEDTHVLRLAVNNLTREVHIAKRQGNSVDRMREEVYDLQRELLQERTKVKALSEELENPANPHRWRRLEGADPSPYEMVQKIQSLQKRLITKTEEVVEKDMLLQEKEKLYAELKNILSRQPGPEIAEQLSIHQQSLREKTKAMKAMASELNMYQAQVNDYKFQMEQSTRELQDVKRQYYEQKRRETLQRGLERTEAQNPSSDVLGSRSKQLQYSGCQCLAAWAATLLQRMDQRPPSGPATRSRAEQRRAPASAPRKPRVSSPPARNLEPPDKSPMTSPRRPSRPGHNGWSAPTMSEMVTQPTIKARLRSSGAMSPQVPAVALTDHARYRSIPKSAVEFETSSDIQAQSHSPATAPETKDEDDISPPSDPRGTSWPASGDSRAMGSQMSWASVR